jgi:group I intron endonuclease
MTGIYGIRNKKNGKMYVGQSVNVSDRFVRHKTELKNNKHKNNHLQRSYNKHGLEQFDFFIIEECEKKKLTKREQEWIDSYPREILYNQQFEVYDLQGERNPFFGKKHTDKSKNKMSEWKKENYTGKNNPNYGKKYSKEVGLKMVRNNPRTKLTQEKVLEIVDLLKNGQPHQQIADLFQISRTVITRISNGTRWTNITGGPVIPIVYKDGVRQFNELHRQRIGDKRKGQKHTKETKQLMSEIAMRKGA